MAARKHVAALLGPSEIFDLAGTEIEMLAIVNGDTDIASTPGRSAGYMSSKRVIAAVVHWFVGASAAFFW